MQAVVDFYYNIGALVSAYSHSSSESGLTNQFIHDVLSKPNMWNTTPLELRDWGFKRQQVQWTPQFILSPNGVNEITVTLGGSVSSDTALEIDLPLSVSELNSLQVLLDGVPTNDYRLTDNGLKVQAGLSSTVTVLYSKGITESWLQTSQQDFQSGTQTGVDADSAPGQVTLALAPSGTLFQDDFSDESQTSSQWIVYSGSWTVNQGYYDIISQTGQLSSTYTGDWSDFIFEARVRYLSGQYGAAIGARLDPVLGSQYSLVLYPNDEGPNRAALVKFSSWADTQGIALDEATISTDTDWHNLRMVMSGNQIKCYYDGTLILSAVDSSYASGGISLESYGDSTVSYDSVIVSSITYSPSGTLVSSPFDSGHTNLNWNILSWMASVPSGTSLQFRLRTAATQEDLVNATWSNYYTSSGAAVSVASGRWIQYEATLSSTNLPILPVLYGVTVSFSYPSPSGTIYMDLTMEMSVTVGSQSSGDPTVSKPIEQSWVANDGTLYASSGNLLFKSLNQGETWSTLKSFSSTIDTIYIDSRGYIFVSPDGSAIASEVGLWKSTDNGLTWDRALVLPDGCSIWGIDEDSNGNLFAGIYTLNSVSNASILKSTNGGDDWNLVYYDSLARHIHEVVVDKTSNYIYASAGDKLYPWNIAYVIRSTDNGETWDQILVDPQMVAIEIIPGARLFATDDPVNGQIYRTTDDETFTKVLDTGGHCYGFWMRTNDLDGRIYTSFVSAEPNGDPSIARIYTSDDNGFTWQIYREFTVTLGYCGSPTASNFVDGVMYYSITLDTGWQNGVRLSTGLVPLSLPQNSLNMDKSNAPFRAFNDEARNTIGESSNSSRFANQAEPEWVHLI